MQPSSSQVSILLLGKRFTIRCPEDKQQELELAAKELAERLQTLRGASKTGEFEQLLVIAALNTAYDFRILQQAVTDERETAHDSLVHLQDLVGRALSNSSP
ncbi:MAG: cell division protein ZapA [Gammaproteobacteria bacterium]|nr:cell division protein ZapA [Gammaproteobacteria bacterium]